ncbi:hypothetical protein [Pseudomonas aeruginosa]
MSRRACQLFSVPEQVLIASVSHDVVNGVGRGDQPPCVSQYTHNG